MATHCQTQPRGLFQGAVLAVLVGLGPCVSLDAAGHDEFQALGLREQRDFTLAVRRLWILGDRSQPASLLGVQAERLNQVFDLFEQNSDPTEALLQRYLSLAFDSKMTIADQSLSFEKKLHWDPDFVGQLYARALKNLPAETPKTFDAVMTQTLTEVDQRTGWFLNPLATAHLEPTASELQGLVRDYLDQNPVQLVWATESPEEWLIASLWLEIEHSVDLNDIADETDLHNGQMKIDRLAERILDSEDFYHYRQAIAQIEDGLWVSLRADDFAYHALPLATRQLLLARIFPDLNFRTSSALIELRLEDVTDEERLHLLSLIPEGDGLMLEWMQVISRLKDQLAHHQWHQKIAEQYLNRWNIQNIPQTMTLYDGTQVPTIRKLRDDMRLLIATHREDIDSGVYPRWLIEDLMVRFFPTPEHLDQERARGRQEDERQKILSAYDREVSALQQSLKKASDLTQKALLEKQIVKATESLNLTLMSYPIDPDSDAQLLAAFNYGLMPHTRDDTLRLAKTAGIGFVFLVAARLLGPKRFFVILMSDLGVRVTVASYRDSQNQGWLDLDLDSPVWTPGLMFAQGLQHQSQMIHSLFSSDDPEDRLRAARDLGQVIQESTVALGVGGTAAAHLRLSRLRNIQKVRSHQRQIESLQNKIRQNQEMIRHLETQKGTLKERADLLTSMNLSKTPEFQRLTSEILSVETRVYQLQGVVATARTRTGFYIERIYSLSLQGLEFVVPWLRAKTSAKIPGERWSDRFRASRMRGIRNFEAEIRAQRHKIQALHDQAFLAQSAPVSFLSPRLWVLRLKSSRAARFESTFKSYTKSQSTLGTAVSEASELSSLKNFSLASKRLLDATRSLKKSVDQIRELKDGASPVPRLRWEEVLVQRADDWIETLKTNPKPLRLERHDPSSRFFSEQRLELRDQYRQLRRMADDLEARESLIADSDGRAAFRTNTNLLNLELDRIQSQLSDLRD